MAVADRVSITVQQGDRYRFPFTVRHVVDGVPGDPLDLTGARIEVSVAKAAGKTPAWTWYSDDDSGRIVIVDAAAGKFAWDIYPEDSRAWGKLAEVEFEVTIEFTETDRLTVSRGVFEVDREVANQEVGGG